MSSSIPFYEIIDLEVTTGFTCTIKFNTEHDILKGHFPGNPVVPGAWLIRIIHETVEKVTGYSLVMSEASQVKFLKPVETMIIDTINLEGNRIETGDNLYRFSVNLFSSEEIFMKFKGTFTASFS
jgi:3-hydroxyacyl-[acyl-carrier-protein] dehydratase